MGEEEEVEEEEACRKIKLRDDVVIHIEICRSLSRSFTSAYMNRTHSAHLSSIFVNDMAKTTSELE